MLDFLARFAADLERSSARDLMHYLKLFPGREEAVAREYLQLTGTTPEESPPAEVPETGGGPADARKRIGPYRLLDEIGRGGQGVVYLAEDTRLGRTVALKVLTRTGGTSTSMGRFRREAALPGRLEHPGICVVYETGSDGERHYIAMRYVAGESLAAKLARGDHLAREDVLRWIEAAARALHAAHEAGIIHRDVKPGNIMITPEGQAVILDFGLARESYGTSPDITLTGDVFGTLAYMSPEQLQGSQTRDRGTDIWSLSVVLYQCLTGTRPFQSATRAGLQRVICEEPPTDPGGRFRDLPSDLRVILEVGLDKDRGRRYVSAEGFAEDLRRVRERRPIRARRPGFLLRARRWIQRSPVLAASLAIGFVFVAATVSYLNLEREQAVDRAERLRSLSLGLLSEVHAQVADLPGATSATRQIAQRALSFLQLISDQPSDNPLEYRRNLVLAHLQVGNVLGNRYHPNLGKPEQALVHYRAALALLDELPRDPRADRQRSECQMLIGQMHAQAGRTAAALSAYDRSLATIPENRATALEAEVRLHRASALLYEGKSASRSAESVAELDKALSVVNELLRSGRGEAGLATLQARLLVTRASVQFARGRRRASSEDYGRGREILEGLPESSRVGLRVRLALADAYRGLAWLQRDGGDVRAALSLLDSAMGILQVLRAADPHNALVLDSLLRARATEGQMHITLEQPTRALAAFDSIRETAEATESRLGRDWSRGHRITALLGVGCVHMGRMEWRRAIDSFDDARGLCEESAARPDAAAAFAQLAKAELYLGRALVRGRRRSAGRKLLARAAARYEQLAVKDPDSHEFFVARKVVCQQLAEVDFSAGRYRDAADWYQKAVDTHRARGLEPSARSRRSLGVLLQGHANCLLQVAARADADERQRWIEATAADFRQAHELFAGLASDDPDDPSVARQLAQSQIGLARVERRLSGTGAALRHAKSAVGTMDDLLKKVETPQTRQRAVLAKALILESLLLDEQGDQPEARAACRRALETLRAIPDPRSLGQQVWLAMLSQLKSKLAVR